MRFDQRTLTSGAASSSSSAGLHIPAPSKDTRELKDDRSAFLQSLFQPESITNMETTEMMFAELPSLRRSGTKKKKEKMWEVTLESFM